MIRESRYRSNSSIFIVFWSLNSEKGKKKSLEREEGKGFWPATLQLQKANIFPFRSGLLRFFFNPILVKGYFKIGNEIIIPNVFSIYFLIIIS
jgi:hypothetical protein